MAGKKTKEGKLREEFLTYGTSNGYMLTVSGDEGEKPPKITKSALMALASADLYLDNLLYKLELPKA
ncbi:MAG: hypothetical protein KJ077_10680 [Anaerolineae bacterium]|nr:hypothetical protein [Anaerolineae bacterium]